MNYIENIQKALDIALKTFGENNGIIVALEDINAPTDTSIPYLSSFQNDTSNGVADLGTTDLREGFYQIDINYEHGLGSAQINKMADKLEEVFFSGSSFEFGGLCVAIESFEPSKIIIGGGWAKKAITINWQCYTNRIL